MNLKKLYGIFLIFVAFIFVKHINAQDIENTKGTERISIFTDRDIYVVGDQILFSANYFVNNTQINPMISKIVYVEMINLNNSTSVVQQIYKIDNYKINGRILIPENLMSGLYMLKVYTNLQKNNINNFGCKYITIINPSNVVSDLINVSDSLQFYLQGNCILNGKKNKIIIKIPESYNLHDKYYFSVNDSIEELFVSDNNLIEIQKTFLSSKHYKFTVNTGDTIISIPFPVISLNGIQTNVTMDSVNTIYKINCKGNEYINQNYKLYIVSEDNEILLMKNIKLDKSSKILVFNNDIFNQGINTLILINENGTVRKNNSVYKKCKQNKILDISLNKNKIPSRDTVEVSVSVDSILIDNLPVISMSVVRKGVKDESDIFNPNFLFQNIKILSSFFENKIDLKNNEINHILIMYDKVCEKNIPDFDNSNHISKIKYLPENRGITLSGVLYNKNLNKNLRNKKIYLSVLNNNPQFHVAITDSIGRFKFILNNVYGLTDIFLCSDFTDNVDYGIRINNPFELITDKHKKYFTPLKMKDKNLIKEIYINNQIEKYFSNKNRLKKKIDTIVNSFNINDRIETIYLKDFITLKNMQEVFNEIVSSVKVIKNKNKYTFRIYDKNSSLLWGKPLVFVDKVPVFDINKIMKFDISKVKKIEVINDVYVLGRQLYPGIIMITTKTDDFAGLEFSDSDIFIKYNTLHENFNKEFPNFINHQLINVPDFRTTLYWNPNIMFHNRKTVHISFTSSDRKGMYKIIIKGYDKFGNLYKGEKDFEVE
ncbi:MAG: hypothetical protein GXO80_04005 [Chlorobi bacterium]|nr:hypothetical protein [Chlorobiota bacterium]